MRKIYVFLANINPNFEFVADFRDSICSEIISGHPARELSAYNTVSKLTITKN